MNSEHMVSYLHYTNNLTDENLILDKSEYLTMFQKMLQILMIDLLLHILCKTLLLGYQELEILLLKELIV